MAGRDHLAGRVRPANSSEELASGQAIPEAWDNPPGLVSAARFPGLSVSMRSAVDLESAAADESHILIILEADISVLGFPSGVGEVFLSSKRRLWAHSANGL